MTPPKATSIVALMAFFVLVMRLFESHGTYLDAVLCVVLVSHKSQRHVKISLIRPDCEMW